MADGFVVLQSYMDSINLLPEERRWPFFEELFRYRIDGTKPQPQTDLELMALVNIFPVIDRSVERYTANKENGMKGGRPRKYIPPEEWKAYLKEHTHKETAEHFGIHVDTLRKWEKAEKPKNQDIDKDKDSDMDTDKDIHIQNNKKNKKEKTKAETQKSLKRDSAIRINNEGIAPCQPGYMFENHGKIYRFNQDKEVEYVGPA